MYPVKIGLTLVLLVLFLHIHTDQTNEHVDKFHCIIANKLVKLLILALQNFLSYWATQQINDGKLGKFLFRAVIFISVDEVQPS